MSQHVIGERTGPAVRYATVCPNCSSTSIYTWSATIAPDRLHTSQSMCQDCSLVFSNPQAGLDAIERYYAHSYYEQGWAYALNRDAAAADAAVARQRGAVARIRAFVPGGTILEIGAG